MPPDVNFLNPQTSFHSAKVRYHDNLLQADVVGTAVCENPARFQRSALVSCKKDITVQLPDGRALMKIKALGKKMPNLD